MRLEPPSWWYGERIPPAAWALSPIAAIYGGIVERRFRTASPYRSTLPVLCVGNFTMGGAGKTPVALKLASMLREAGGKPGFLTRGYGGSERGPYLIDSATDGSDRVGDEPLLLARSAPTVVSRDRPAGAKLLETLGVDAIFMDDGFQNPALEKDFSLIVVDGGAGVGCGHVFPLGPLRARLPFQIQKADAVVIVGSQDRTNVAELIEQRSQQFRSAPLPVFSARIVPAVRDELRSRPFLAFCGIGRPAKFFDTLREAGIAVVKTRSFPDHHAFSDADARSLLSEANALNAGLVTTEKDHARLTGENDALGELFRSALALPIDVAFADGGEARLSRLMTSLSFRKPLAAIRDCIVPGAGVFNAPDKR
jgi:tetraacyldisaccharide 4'-kinase